MSRQDQAGVRQAPITAALIAINAVVFALEEAWGGSGSTETLVRMGAIFPPATGLLRWTSLLAYGYLHIGVVHLGMNMLGLWSIGRMLEPLLGASRFFVLYTLSLLGGGIAIQLSPDPRVTAGASGALFGLMGAVCALLWRRYRSARVAQERQAIRGMIGRMMLPNVLISLLPGVSLLGHAGGLLVGAAHAALMMRRGTDQRAHRSGGQRAGMTRTALLLAVLTLCSIAWLWWSFEPWLARDASA